MVDAGEQTTTGDEGTPEEEFLYLLSEGSDLLGAGRIREAVEQFEHALSERPGHQQAENLLGLALFRLGDLGRAAELFEGLVHDNPTEPSLRLNLAMVHLKSNHLEEAKDELEKVLDLSPDHVRAAAYMAMVCERLERFVEAGDWYERAGNDKQAEAMRAKVAPLAAVDLRAETVKVPFSDLRIVHPDEGGDVPPDENGEEMAMPEPGEAKTAPPPSPEVQAAAMNVLRAETLGRASERPSTDEADAARASSSGFTLEEEGEPPPPEPLPPAAAAADAESLALEDIPGPPPLDDGDRVESTMPYATLPPGFEPDPLPEPSAPPPPDFDTEVSFADVVVPDPASAELPPDEVEGTMPYAVLPSPPPGKAALDAPDAPKDPATRAPIAAVEDTPMEVSASDIELIPLSDEGEPVVQVSDSLDDIVLENAQPVEKTLPWATRPPPPPGKLPLDSPDDDEPIVAPVAEAATDEMPPPKTEAIPSEPEPTPPPVGDSLEMTSGPAPADDSPPPMATLRTAVAPRTIADIVDTELSRRPDAPTLTESGHFLFPINETAYLRTDLLVSLVGSFEVEPVNRRYRGRRTDSLFGGTTNPFVAALGNGVAWLDPGETEATVLSLASDELYLIETTLLGFSSGLVWENGRLPDADAEDLDIVHLRGSGRVAVLTQRSLVGVEVTAAQPVTVRANRLVGWSGPLVPSRGPFPGLPEEATRPSVVRFEGSGRLLLG